MERKLSKKQRRKYSQLKVYERSMSCSDGQLFVPALSYPSFFDENLVDDDRKIKIFKNNPHAHEIIFYFQLLKLIFDCEESDYQKYLQKIYDLLQNPEFQIQMPKQGSPYYVGMSSNKTKKILGQFLDEMGEGQLGVEQGLKKYPIVNKLLVLFFRTILIIAQQCAQFEDQVQPSEIYDLLGNYFDLEITYYGNCLRFNQVDVFVYLHQNQQVYLAYVSPSVSQQEILDSSELYQNDPAQAFNISSVRQMVSEIDIPVDTECFDTSKQNLNQDDTQEVQYNYSHSQDVKLGSRSLAQGSQLKFSYLINDDSIQNLNVIKSNKVLEKSIIGEKKPINPRFVAQIDCYKIEQVPFELQNAVSPIVTPRQTQFVAFNREEIPKFDQANIYRKKKSTNIRDIIRQEYELLSTYESDVKPKAQFEQILKDTADTEWGFRKDGPKFLEELQVNKPTTTLRSLYEGKSIKSICGSDSQSYLLGQTPYKISKFSSRSPTIQNRFEETILKEEASRNKNISSEFTSSFVLRQMQEPYQSHIRSIKTRSRNNRENVRKVILF